MKRPDLYSVIVRISLVVACSAMCLVQVWAEISGGAPMTNHDSILNDTRLWEKIARIAAGGARTDGVAEFLDREDIQRTLQDGALRLQDFQAFQVMAYTLIADPHDRETQALYCYYLRERRYYVVALADPFLANYPSILAPVPRDMIHVGTMPNGGPVGYPPGQTSRNVLLVGSTGSGKTEMVKRQIVQLVERGYLVVVLERKSDHADLAMLSELANRTTVLNFRELAISLYQSPPGVEPSPWHDEVTKLISGSYGRLSAHRLLRDLIAMEESLKAVAGEYFPLSQIIAAVDAFKPSFGRREAEYKESVLYVLKDMFHATRGIFEYRSSNCLEVLFSKPGLVVINSETLAVDNYQFLSNLLMRWPYIHRLYNRSARAIPIAFVFEDATSAIPQPRDWESPGITPLADALFTQRFLNIGCCLVGHSLTIAEPLLANIETKILLTLHSEDRRKIEQIWGLTPEQADIASRLGLGEFIALVPSFHNQAVRGTFQPLRLPGSLSESARKASAERFLRQVKAIPAGELPARLRFTGKRSGKQVSYAPASAGSPPDEAGMELSQPALELLKQAATGLPDRVTNLYERAGLSRGEGSRAVKELEAVGLVRPHRFTTGQRGGAVTLLEPTAFAWRLLAAYQIKIPAPKTGGGWEHKLAARLIEAEGKRQGMRVRFEISLGGVRLDVAWRGAKGDVTFFNVGISSAEREVENACKAIAEPALQGNTLVLVCRDTAFRERVNLILKAMDDSGNAARRIQVALITDFLI
ncbi:hypothetical protein HS125_11390 [bacterium]|nr:hypothetical protein [bacterium]